MTHINHYTNWLAQLDDILTSVMFEDDSVTACVQIQELRMSILNARRYDATAPITGDFGPVPKPPIVGSILRREAEASVALDGETQSIEPLPPMQPIIGRKVKSKDLKCTTCGAKPGTECFEMSSRGPHATPTDVRRQPGSTTHHSRRRAAKAANS